MSRLEIRDDLRGGELVYSNLPGERLDFKLRPGRFGLEVRAEQDLEAEGTLAVEARPAGSELKWGEAQSGAAELKNGLRLECRIPAGTTIPQPGRLELEVRVVDRRTGQVVGSGLHPVRVVWIGHSGFDPAVHGYNFVNSSEAYGQVSLERPLFERTYGLVVGKERLFRKMYRDILGATVDEKGPIAGAGPLSSGLCTGMIRSTLDFYQRGVEPVAHDREPTGDTLTTIKLFHGRQLSDRTLLEAARWIVNGGPRRVFETFKREVLRGNKDPLAFDIGVAAWGRKDFWRAIQAEGHTVVPYAFRQGGPDEGEIFIYNPNNPPDRDGYGYANAPAGEEARLSGPVIKFDLFYDKYYYTEHYQSVRPNGDKTTIVAVHQSAYQKEGSALIASIANFFI